MRPSLRIMGDIVLKAIFWNVWLARNDRMFYVNAVATQVIILNVDRMLLSLRITCFVVWLSFLVVPLLMVVVLFLSPRFRRSLYVLLSC